MSFSASLINWYHTHQRELPWRNTQNPYLIWLSEVILQQTRVDQGLPYYERFAARYPNIHSLARAHDDDVMKLWQGLGYYSRARNMLATARFISTELQGKFPETARELGKLKGIGPYTAAAIASFAFHEPVAVVDGNVYRVLARYLGIDVPVDSTEGKKIFAQAASELLDKQKPALYNQAIMEFGALHCKPASPRCDTCVLAEACYARKENKVDKLPVKGKKKESKERFLQYLLIRHEGHTYLRKRDESDIWKNLYELPLLESERKLSQEELLTNEAFKKLMQGASYTMYPFPEVIRHLLTHRILITSFWQLEVENKNFHPGTDYQKVKLEDLHKYAIPRVLDIYLKKINLV